MDLNNIGVIGAGMMGSEIALVFALAGRSVMLADTSRENVTKAIARLHRTLDKGCERKFWTAEAAATARKHLNPADSLAAFSDRDLIIEAVFEDETVKAEVLQALDATAPAHAIIASNTSSISITALSANVSAQRRQKFLGTHFFSPVSRMPLVEVIPALDTHPDVVAAVTATCRAIGKTPVRIKDVPGFAVNRLLHAFFIEAVKLIEEDVATPADIDIACKLGLGHPMGPFELMDVVTNRLTLQVQEVLHANYGERFMPSHLLRQMVKAGYNGRASGRGWFHHGDKP